ncbi:MAG TPA: ABC transporter permease, partial [Puia sp.]
MFQNFFRTAWRNLLRNRVYSAINILGLAIGMAVALLIGLWVQFQFSYDRNLPGYERVAQMHLRFTRNGEPSQMMSTPLPLSKAMREEVPGIKYAAHTDWMGSHGLVVGEKKVFMNGGAVGEDFFRIFPFPVVRGDVNKALQEPYNIIITESTSRTLFGDADPMGRKIRIDNRQDLEVAAIIRDLPPNSTFSFKYIIPFSYSVLTSDWVREGMTNWDNNSFQTFVQLEPNARYAQMAPKLHALVMKYDPEAWKVGKEEFFFHPMKDWHLYGDFKKGVVDGGFIEYVRLFSIIGVLVLLIACVNFMNLSTARSEKRAREVGVRKVMGSLRRDLIVQFLTESMLITLAAAFLALVLVQLVLPAFNILTKSRIDIPWGNPVFWGVMALYVLVTGLLAGSRPAFYLSGFQPVKVLKAAIRAGRSATLPRRILVVLQFTCSIALIISTLLIYQQVQYAKDRPSGYNASRLVFADGSEDLNKNYAALRGELLQSGLVDKVTRSSSPVTQLWSWSLVQNWPGKGPDETLSLATVDIGDDYFSTMGMQLAAGRNYTGNFAADTSTVIINEAAAKKMRLKDPVGQVITWRLTPHKIVGVVKDALMQSPYRAADPTFFYYNPPDALNITY